MPNTPVKVTLTAGDRLRLIRTVLEDDGGNPVDLSGGTVTFRMVDYWSGDVVIAGSPAVKLQIDANRDTWGSVVYVWQAGDTDVPGLYQGWFVFQVGGLTSHFPPDGDFYVLIQPAP